MYFSLQFSTLEWLLLGISLGLLLFSFIFFLGRYVIVRRGVRLNQRRIEPERYQDAAIVVYSNDEGADLEVLLPQLLTQEYPARYEVIVVNEGDSPSVRETVGFFQNRYNNLYVTHTPDGARNLSRKKLAITLGIKATRKPVVVMTTASARINSNQWLKTMMRHFDPDGAVEVVLGYAATPEGADTGLWKRMRAFDRVADAARWISPALCGHPWRGTEHNLAYRTDLFFRNKGFSRHLNLRHGDDDILVSEIAKGYNTAVELSPAARVEVPAASGAHAAKDNAARRIFTERFIKHRPRLLEPLAETAYLLAPMPALAAMVLTPFNQGLWAAFGLIFIIWFSVAMLWRHAMKNLETRTLCLTLPFAIASRPLRKAIRFSKSLLKHGKRYTWE